MKNILIPPSFAQYKNGTIVVENCKFKDKQCDLFRDNETTYILELKNNKENKINTFEDWYFWKLNALNLKIKTDVPTLIITRVEFEKIKAKNKNIRDNFSCENVEIDADGYVEFVLNSKYHSGKLKTLKINSKKTRVVLEDTQSIEKLIINSKQLDYLWIWGKKNKIKEVELPNIEEIKTSSQVMNSNLNLSFAENVNFILKINPECDIKILDDFDSQKPEIDDEYMWGENFQDIEWQKEHKYKVVKARDIIDKIENNLCVVSAKEFQYIITKIYFDKPEKYKIETENKGEEDEE